MPRPQLSLCITAVATALVSVIATQSGALAQTPTPGPPGPMATAIPTAPPGNVVWAFAPENPLFDSRVAGALGTAMEPFIRDSVPAGSSIVRVEPHGPDLRPATIYPVADVPLLLRAAGYGNTPPFTVVGPCRAWSASPQASDVVTRLDVALQKALAGLGITVESCMRTTNPAEAHILAWRQGDAPPALVQRDRATFLGAPAQSAPPAGGPPLSNVPVFPPGSSPRPATTGTAGLEASRATQHAVPVLLVAFGAMMVVGGRRFTRRA